MEAIRKHSKKREALLEALRGTTDHPSAEMLYARLKPMYPELSLGTVYRNLSMFLRDGEVISVGSVSGQERYDACTRPHAHFVCTRCGRVLDVQEPELREIEADVARETGGRVTGHALSFRGDCADCLSKTAV